MPSCACPSTDYSANLCLGPFVTGDEWDGQQFTIWVDNASYDPTATRTDTNAEPGTGSNPKYVSASAAYTPMTRAIMQVHTSETNLDKLVDLDSDATGVTIDDAAEWVFTVEPYTFTLSAGTYFVAIACENTGGGWKTFFKGTLTLTKEGVDPT